MPIGQQPFRGIAGAGYDPELSALLTVDVDVEPLNRGLNQAKGVAQRATNQMAADTTRNARRMSFALQNVGYQVGDFVTQVSSGTNPIRAFAQQIGQAAQAFAIIGGAAGAIAIPASIALTVVGGLATAFFNAGKQAKTYADEINTLDDALKHLSRSSAELNKETSGLATAFADANYAARQLILAKAQEEYKSINKELTDTGTTLDDITSKVDELVKNEAIIPRALGLDEDVVPDKIVAQIEDLFDQLAKGGVGAVIFRNQVDALRQKLSPELSKAFEILEKDAIKAAETQENLRQKVEAAKKAIEEMQVLLKKGLGPTEEVFGPPATAEDALGRMNEALAQLSERLSIAVAGPLTKSDRALISLASAAHDAGMSLEDLLSRPSDDALRQVADRYAALAEALHQVGVEADLAEAKNKRLQQAGINLQQATREARGAGFPGGGAEAVQSAFRGLPPRPALKPLEAAPTEVLTTYDRINAKLTEQGAQKARLVELQSEINRALEAQQISEEQAAELNERAADAVSGRAARIEAGGRLPDAIDAANIAAQDLSTTLTDVNNLTFDGLIQSFAQITQQILQMIIQALIFRAIMAGLGFAGGGAGGGAVLANAPAGGPVRRGGYFEHGRFQTAQSGAVFRRGEMALMTGRTSGAALLEGAGDEGVFPLGRDAYGRMGVHAADGGGGGGIRIGYLDARGATPGVEANIRNALAGDIRRLAPSATKDAEERGLVRTRRRWG